MEIYETDIATALQFAKTLFLLNPGVRCSRWPSTAAVSLCAIFMLSLDVNAEI
jgi:hypothetical protein